MLNGWERKAKQLLFDQRGRDALKKYGLDVEIAKDEKPDDKPIVVVMCPTYRSPEPQTRDSVIAMKEFTRDSGKAIVYDAPPISAAVVHWSRNALVQGQLQSGKPWTHALLVDDDMVPDKEDLVRLLSHKKDIVVGICTCRTDPPMPNIKEYDETTGNFGRIWEWPNHLFEIGGGGTGFMLVSRHAFEQTAQVYFDCLWEQDFYGLSGEKLDTLKKVRLAKFDEDKTCFWFRFVPNPKGEIEMGEDMGFCYMARKYAGIPTFADPQVQPGHIGKYAFGIKDFEPYRDDCIMRAKISGEYKMEVPPMTISILCPTRKRPEMVRNMYRSIAETSTVMPELVYYVDDDDNSFPAEIAETNNVTVIRGPRILMTEMWNRCAEAATGEIMLLSGDDVLFKTKGWDDQVRRAFAAFPDRLALVHGDDGIWGSKFGTHCFLHRAWIETVGYFSPPYFSSDYGDTWINDVFNAVNRRVYLPIVTEHLHPMAGKGAIDQTHKDRLERHKQDDCTALYAKLAPKRLEDIRKVRARLGIPWEANANDDAHQPCLDTVGREVHAARA